MKEVLLKARSVCLKYLLPVALVLLAILGFSSIRRRAQSSIQAPEPDKSKEILIENQAKKTDSVNRDVVEVSKPAQVVKPKPDASVDELIDTYNKL